MVGPRAARLTVLYVSEAYTPHDRRFLTAMAGRVRTAWLCLDAASASGETRPLPSSLIAFHPEPSDGPHPSKDPDTIAGAIRRCAGLVTADLVHGGPVPTAGLGAVRAGMWPAVIMAWGSDVLLADETSGRATAIREAVLGAAGFVGDAACVEEKATALGLPKNTPRAIFPWGVESASLEPPVVRSERRARLGWADAHVCISTRAWKSNYRIDVLLDAFEAARRTDPKLRLLLLGDGDQAPVIRARVRDGVASGVVLCPGQVPENEMRSWFEAADLYVSSVPSDGSSISLLEAMAAARPAIVVDAPGNREWIRNGQAGWLVPPGSSTALAAALQRAFLSPISLREVGTRARQVVIERARWDSNVEQLFRLYEEVMDRARRKG